MAKTTLKSLLRDAIEQVKDSPVPIRVVEFDPATKRFRVEFGGEAPAPASALPVALPPPAPGPMTGRGQETEVKFLPGTRIPDDLSPLDPLEIVQANVGYHLDTEGRAPSNGEVG